jgi:hypothetical protein
MPLVSRAVPTDRYDGTDHRLRYTWLLPRANGRRPLHLAVHAELKRPLTIELPKIPATG